MLEPKYKIGQDVWTVPFFTVYKEKICGYILNQEGEYMYFVEQWYSPSPENEYSTPIPKYEEDIYLCEADARRYRDTEWAICSQEQEKRVAELFAKEHSLISDNDAPLNELGRKISLEKINYEQ